MIKQIGKHRVKLGNLMDGIDDLMQNEKAEIFYSDPPWGQGHLRFWQTMNSKMNDVPKIDIEHSKFIDKVFEIAKKFTEKYIFIEYGIRWKDEIINLGKSKGLIYLQTWDIKYRGGGKILPLHLHLFSNGIKDYPVECDLCWNTLGFETLYKAVGPVIQKDKIILDPACGLGNTAKLAISFGMKFYGNEINEKRLSKTIEILR